MNNTIAKNGTINSSLPQSNFHSDIGLLQIALRHRWIILPTVLLFLAAAFIYLSKATPIYTSTSRLYVEQTGPKIITDYEGVMTQAKNYLYTQCELIKSSPIITKVVDNEQIKHFNTFAGIDNLSGYVRNNLDVSVGKKDDLLSVSFDSPYPAEAAQIVNALVDSYVDYYTSRKRSTASEVLRILEKEKDKRDRELSEKLVQTLEFTRKNGVVSFDKADGHVVFQRLSKLSAELTEAQMATVNVKVDYEAIQNMANDPIKIKQFSMSQPGAAVHVFVSDEEALLRDKLKDTEAEFKKAKSQVTEDHPIVKSILAKIIQIKQQIDEQNKKFAEAYIETMRLKWVSAKSRENELLASFNDQQKAAQEISVKAAEYSVIQSELKRTERLCEILDNRIKELNVTEDVGALNISILEVARPADSPSMPKRTKILGLALIFGFIFGVGFAFLRDMLDYRIRSADEIASILGIPILGIVPAMPQSRMIGLSGQKGFRSVLAGIYARLRGNNFRFDETEYNDFEKSPILERAKKIRCELQSKDKETYRTVRLSMLADGIRARQSRNNESVSQSKKDVVLRGQKVHLDSKSNIAEAYRTIRTAVFFGVPKDQAKTIVVTSPAPSDGKTTLASNLAIAMAQAGQKTLLFDCDFRKPMQHNIFEVENETGLASVFAGFTDLDNAILSSPISGLDLLLRGHELPNPSEILNSTIFAKILASLAQRYDRIIVDAPPIASVADSQILAAICDVTILVLRAEKSTRKLSQYARDSITNVGGHLLGIVVNDVAQQKHHYGYYSGYGTGYYGQDTYYGKDKNKQSTLEPVEVS
jgi:capsular exopolysaccharide synthesis family protein